MGKIAKDDEVLLELGLADSATSNERAIVIAAINKAEGAVRRHLKYDPVRLSRTEFYPQTDFRNLSQGGQWESDGTNAVFRREAAAAVDELQVRHIPIRSVTSLRIDHNARSGATPGSFPASSEQVEGTDFWPNYDAVDSQGDKICMDGIIRSFGAWPITPGNVRIVYEAGYTDEELRGNESVIDASPILGVVISEAVRKAKKVFVNMKHARVGFVAGLMTSERMGDYAYTIDATSAAELFGPSWDLMLDSKEALQEFVNLSMAY